MRRTRQVIAVMVVATALCADRSVSAAPVLRPQSQGFARTFASKLTTSLRRAVASTRVESVRTNEIGLANVEIPGEALAPGVRLEVGQTMSAAKESDGDQNARASRSAGGLRVAQSELVTADLPVEPEPQVAYFLVGEPRPE